MDRSGKWHDTPSAVETSLEQRGRAARGEPVITIGIGETVRIEDERPLDGDIRKVECVFEGAEKNRVRLRLPERPPYFDFSSYVTVTNAAGETCRALVWDNRGGILTLRTMPQ